MLVLLYSNKVPSCLDSSVSSLDSSQRGDSDDMPPNMTRELSVVLSGDASLSDDSSVSSTPFNSTDTDVDVPLRKTFRSGHLDEDVEVTEVIDQFMKSQWELEEDSSPPRLTTSISYERPPLRSPLPEGHHRRSSSLNRQSNVGSQRMSLGDISERASRRGLTRMTSQTSRASRSSNPSPSHRRISSKTGSRGSLSSDELFAADGECLYVFEASHRGILGLAIEPCRRGTRIHGIKDFSPLFGLAKAGDRVVDVDGIDVTHKTTAGVAELLRRKKGRNKKIRITVARNDNDTGSIPALPIMSRSRSKSSGNIAIYVPGASPAKSDYSGLRSPVTDLDSSYELHTPTNEEKEEPFHFIGAAPYEEDYESFSDPGL